MLVHCDNLMQRKDISAAEGQLVANLTAQTLDQTEILNFLEQIGRFEVLESTLPQPRKVPRRLESGNAAPEFPATACVITTDKCTLKLWI